MSEQELFDSQCAQIYTTRGYMVVSIDEEMPIGSIIGPAPSDNGSADVNQPMRIMSATTEADFVGQCQLVGWKPDLNYQQWFYRVESD